MALTVTPDSYSLVSFDATELREIAEATASKVLLPPDFDFAIEVDETTPTGRVMYEEVSPGRARIKVESGAIEDPRYPRQLSRGGAELVFGTAMLRVMDWVDPGFGYTGSVDDELPVPLSIAWQVYEVGKLHRLGFERARRERYLYLWRNRHGFNDIADEAFERVWGGGVSTWDEIVSVCEKIKEKVAAATSL